MILTSRRTGFVPRENALKMFSKLAMKTQEEADFNGDRAMKWQREVESTSVDAEGMLQVMSAMESQIVDLSAREDLMIVIIRESKQRVEDALVVKDQARVLEIQSRR